MPIARVGLRLAVFLVAFSAGVSAAGEIGQEIANQVNAANYQFYLDDLLYTHDGNNRDAVRGPEHDAALENIVAVLQSFGLRVELQSFVYGSTTCYNVIATQVGTVYPEAYFVVGAHYDSGGTPGADDNASGVAGVLEVARVLSTYPTEYTIKYMAFDAEEYWMRGSQAYVDAHLSDDIRGMISMDMLGYNDGNYCAQVSGPLSSLTIKNDLLSAVQLYANGLNFTPYSEGGSARSDHGPFYAAGFQACLLIEMSADSNPCYHHPCDSVDTADYISYSFATRMTRGVAGYLADHAAAYRPFECSSSEGCDPADHDGEDCNGNGVWDRCDIACGTSDDVNADGIPDECEPHETWYVDAANCPGPGSGTEDDPFCRIQAAINAASSSPDAVIEIIVADGVYTGTGNRDLDFGGKVLTLRSNGGAGNCTIDCQGSGSGFYFHSGEPKTARVIGFTIRGASASGIYCEYAWPTIVGCLITGNTAANGGGVACLGAGPTLTRCTIADNTASSAGAGLYCGLTSTSYAASPTLTDCTIRGNGGAGSGGGVCCTSGNSTIACNATFVRTTISNNSAGAGAGMYCFGSNATPKLTDCLISENKSVRGGGLYCYQSSPVLTSCWIRDNLTWGSYDSSGGGIYCTSSASPKLNNCIISGNRAGSASNCYGGGVYCSSSNPRLTNCTLSANRATTGGGVYCSSSSPQITNCILWADTPGEIGLSSGTPAVTYCDVQGGYTGTGNINLDPRFSFVDDSRLMSGSPGIDAGTNSPTAGLPEFDADGNPRSKDGNGDGQSVADMGAYEYDPTAPSIALSPPTFEIFTYGGDAEPIERTFSIRSNTGATLTWEVTADCSWTSAYPASGSCQQETDSVALAFDITGLNAGDYYCTVVVSAPEALNSPRQIPVVLHVGAARRVPSDYSTIQAAIDAAARYDWVLIADGVYTGAGNKDVDYHGKAITVGSASGNPGTCIIDCEGSGRGFYFHTRETAASVVRGLTIRNGYATSSSPGSANGGGVFCFSSNPTLIKCRIEANTASSGKGGGVSCSYACPEMMYCTISENTGANGGGVCCTSADPTLTQCTVCGNAGDVNGGGLYCDSYSRPVLTDCAIIANRALGTSSGGGLFCSSANPTLTNCTISGNTASAAGGGIYCSSTSSSPKLANCILWGDTPQEISGGTSVVTYCDVQGGSTGTGIINLDPLFADPDGPDNDPATWQDNDYRPAAGSPCIDAGKNAAFPTGILTDLDGRLRFFDDPDSPDCRYVPGTCGTAPIIDMGAYEYQPLVILLGDLNCDGLLDIGDVAAFALSLVDPAGYGAAYPECDIGRADMNADGAADGLDVQPFVDALLGG